MEPNITADDCPLAGEDDATACDRYAGYSHVFSDLRCVLRDLGVASGVASSELNLLANSIVQAVLDDTPTADGAVDRVAEEAHRDAILVAAFYRIRETKYESAYCVAGIIHAKMATYASDHWPKQRNLLNPPPSVNGGIDDLLWQIKKLKRPMQGIGVRRISDILSAALIE